MNKFANLNLFTLLLLLVFSCGKLQVENSKLKSIPERSDNDSLEIIKIANSSSNLEWGENYSRSIIKNFERVELAEILQHQIANEDLLKLGCPNYNQLSLINKKFFWVNLIASIAESESDFDNYNQTRTPSDRTMNIGLLQIDIASALRHSRGTGIVFSEGDLFEGEKNLLAGMFIMRNQLRNSVSNNRIFPETTYYWEVLAHPNRMIAFFHKNLWQISECNSLAANFAGLQW